ncbi:MAG: hypothetical protein E6767_14410 [Dysgonomonas sp.]|nr:hypothetical protein [Dysgonomonas sp.]
MRIVEISKPYIYIRVVPDTLNHQMEEIAGRRGGKNLNKMVVIWG